MPSRSRRWIAELGEGHPGGVGTFLYVKTLAASAVVKNAEGQILLVLWANEPEARCWTIPGGRVKPGHTLEDAAVR